MKVKLTREDWEDAKAQNINLIKGNMQQIEMANLIVEMCDKKIAEFPEPKKKETPIGVG